MSPSSLFSGSLPSLSPSPSPTALAPPSPLPPTAQAPTSPSPPPPMAQAPRYSKRKRGEAPEFSALPSSSRKQRKTTTMTTTSAAAAGLPAQTTHRNVVTPPLVACPIPSPHAPFAGVDLSACLFTGTSLWKQVSGAWNLVHDYLDASISDDSDKAYACWVRAPTGAADEAGFQEKGLQYTQPICQESVVGEYVQISWDDQVASVARPKKGRKAKMNALRARRAMEIWREGTEHFLRWEKMQEVKINGEICIGDDDRDDVVIGPLPAFAVIQVESTVIFWWKDGSALGYGQLPVEEQAPTTAEQQDRPETVAESAATEKAIRERWHEIWADSYQKHASEAEADSGKFPTIMSTENLLGDETYLGIACVWASLLKQDKLFAFHDQGHYDFMRTSCEDTRGYREKIEAAVNGPQDLIIPLVFAKDVVSPPSSATFHPDSGFRPKTPPPALEPDTSKGKAKGKWVGKDGHTLLAVARKEEAGVVIKVMDSVAGYYPIDRIRGAIEKIINRSGWLGMDREGNAMELDNPPKIHWEQMKVPRQVSTDSCGVHAILNAWIHMLGLPTLDALRRRAPDEEGLQDQEEKAFITHALGTINKALSGHMDLYTIQAFLNAYGYCQLQSPDDATIRLSQDDHTTGVTMDIFMDLLQERREIQQTTAPAPERRRFVVRNIEEVRVQTKCSHTEALDLMEAAHGDVELAVKLRLFMQQAGCSLMRATRLMEAAGGNPELAIAFEQDETGS
ncbi:MAG: hypothetical protein Q9222_006747 [Ikaeria aurantiellina]